MLQTESIKTKRNLRDDKRIELTDQYERLFQSRIDYVEGCLWIRTKDQRLIPLHLNEPQEQLFLLLVKLLESKKFVRVIIFKARQEGISTAIQALFFHYATTHPYTSGLTVAHDLDSSDELFGISRLFYDNLPEIVKPMVHFSNRKELIFENPDQVGRSTRAGLRSQLRVNTSGKPTAGRSKTIHLLHKSEVAFWENASEVSLSLDQAVPDTLDTMIFEESTANGLGGKFYQDWQKAKKGETDYVPFFLPWFALKDYSRPIVGGLRAFEDSLDEEERKLRNAYKLTLEQLNWRRWAIPNKCNGDIELFHQEYPSDDVEAFLASGRLVFSLQILRDLLAQCRDTRAIGNLKSVGSRIELDDNPKGFARMWRRLEPGHSYVIGADPAP